MIRRGRTPALVLTLAIAVAFTACRADSAAPRHVLPPPWLMLVAGDTIEISMDTTSRRIGSGGALMVHVNYAFTRPQGAATADSLRMRFPDGRPEPFTFDRAIMIGNASCMPGKESILVMITDFGLGDSPVALGRFDPKDGRGFRNVPPDAARAFCRWHAAHPMPQPSA